MQPRNKPFRARVRNNNSYVELGYFATSEECEAAKNEYHRTTKEKTRRCITASQLDGLTLEEHQKVHLSILPSRLVLILEQAEADKMFTVSELKRSMRRTLECIHPNNREDAIIEAMRLPEMIGLVEKIEGISSFRTKWKKVAKTS